ncbi:hypothetical protein AVEN_66931-1, partial [Araneus ventricosus]
SDRGSALINPTLYPVGGSPQQLLDESFSVAKWLTCWGCLEDCLSEMGGLQPPTERNEGTLPFIMFLEKEK